ncbi:MAG TPA: trypsin-like peptidase domain-containing protein, partial [Chthonomonadales bacterium]|nr:trypsin-like peptidase domain-containing protein [Chthonomonadales bacterium]
MRKAFPYLIIFAVGGVLTWVLLRTLVWTGESREERARLNALAILDRPPIPANIPDNPLVTAAAKIEPAVVNIDTLAERTFRGIDFFGQPQTRSILTQGKGSGVIITPDGYIVTNSHVIEGAAIIRVTMVDGKKYQGRVIGS